MFEIILETLQPVMAGDVSQGFTEAFWPLVAMAGASAASSIFGGIAKSRSAEKAAAEQARLIQAERAREAAHYNRVMNEDGTQRADVRRALTIASDNLRRQNRAAAGKLAVIGGSNAEVAAQKEASAAAYGDAVSQAAAAAESRRDAADARHEAQMANNLQQDIAMSQQRTAANQASIDAAAGGIGSASNALMGAYAQKYIAKNG